MRYLKRKRFRSCRKWWLYQHDSTSECQLFCTISTFVCNHICQRSQLHVYVRYKSWQYLGWWIEQNHVPIGKLSCLSHDLWCKQFFSRWCRISRIYGSWCCCKKTQYGIVQYDIMEYSIGSFEPRSNPLFFVGCIQWLQPWGHGISKTWSRASQLANS